VQSRGTRAGHATDIRRRDNVKAPRRWNARGRGIRRVSSECSNRGTLAVSGHVFRVERKRGPQWYVKYRVGSRQIQKRLGPAWLEPGQAPPGCYTREAAEAELAAILTDARRAGVSHSEGSGVTVAQAAEEWLRNSEWARGVKASTLSEYRSIMDAHIVPRFGDYALEAVAAREIEAWAAELLASGRSRRTVNKIRVMFGGVFERARRVWDIPSNPRGGSRSKARALLR
jgi:integrase